MKKFFVVGEQTSQSLSPLIFNHWFKKYNIQAKYSFLEVTKKNFNSEIVKKLNDKKTQGLNVTIPFKKDIIKYLDNKNVHAQKIGAVNCVTVGKKIKKGDTVMIVEAMKTMNHVPSTADGVVKEICVEDGQPVEFGQTIIILE